MTTRTLAIIGVGPRGHYAFECLLRELEGDASRGLRIVLFEETGDFGNGAVYDARQPDTNWINISERVIELPARPRIEVFCVSVPAFPSLLEWLGSDGDAVPDDAPDRYPPRARIGQYLNARFDSLSAPFVRAGVASLHAARVVQVEVADASFSLTTPSETFEGIDEVLLTIGHQTTEPDEQIEQWRAFADAHPGCALHESPYPVSAYANGASIKPASTVAIRGFGLAMIDVARAIASEYGEFVRSEGEQRMIYRGTAGSGELEGVLVPFSLDGLPPAPKPLNARIDGWFAPDEAERDRFQRSVGDTAAQAKATGADFIIEPMATIVARVFASLPETTLASPLSAGGVEGVAGAWLRDESYGHDLITPRALGPAQTMRRFVAMATGEGPISLDYCVGQVWRHLQPTMYAALSHGACSDQAMAAIIGLDERIKRYAYGPPVDSLLQLLAMIDAGFMNVDLARDPQIELVDGWRLRTDGAEVLADVMIDSVLDSPKLKLVDTPIVEALLHDDVIQPVHDDLGVHTDPAGYVVSPDRDRSVPLALLGRLAKGTIIGVDAILECFGERPRAWADEAAARHRAWLADRAPAEA